MSKQQIESITDTETLKGKLYKYIKVSKNAKIKLSKDDSEPVEVSSVDLEKLFTGEYALDTNGLSYSLKEITDEPDGSLELWAYARLSTTGNIITVHDAEGNELPEGSWKTITDNQISITINGTTVTTDRYASEVTEGFEAFMDTSLQTQGILYVYIYKKTQESIVSFYMSSDRIISNIDPDKAAVTFAEGTFNVTTDNDIKIVFNASGTVKGSDGKQYVAICNGSGWTGINAKVYDGSIKCQNYLKIL